LWQQLKLKKAEKVPIFGKKSKNKNKKLEKHLMFTDNNLIIEMKLIKIELLMRVCV
jgi:hypothetical protein